MIDWIECSYRHKLKQIDKIDLDAPSEHTEFGGILHNAIEQYLLGASALNAEAVGVEVIAALKKLPNFQGDPEEWADTIPAIFEELPGFLAKTFQNYSVVSAEHALMETLEKKPGRFFKGFIDCVLKADTVDPITQVKDDVYWIIDWKGQRLTAPILTPSGWTTMGNLKIGDQISSSDGTPSKVEAIFPLGEREIYRVTFRDGSFVDTTNDHLWECFRSGQKTPKILTTVEMMSETRYKHIKTPKPIEFAKKHDFEYISPYLMGALLGDGTFRGKIGFSSADEFIVNKIQNLLPEFVTLKKTKGTNWDYAISLSENENVFSQKNPLIQQIKKLGLFNKFSHEKFVPTHYLFGTINERLELLQGLLDTDGWVQKGIAKYSTTSEQLAKDVKHLTCSLGGVAFVSSRHKKRFETEKQEYIVTVKLSPEFSPFSLPRKKIKMNSSSSGKLWRTVSKIELLEEKAPMQCIGVSAKDHLYVTNDFILTHNTTDWGWTGSKKRDPLKQMQLGLYKHFWSLKTNIPLDKIKCGWVLLKRTAEPGQHIELISVDITDEAIQKSLGLVYSMISSMEKKIFTKNRNHCRFCPYLNTEHCT